jgi:hypothetical protein
MSYKKKVLLDHLKKGSTFYPPFTFKSGKPDVQEVEWRADILPELLWLALLINTAGFERAKLISQNMGYWASQCHDAKFKPNFGLVSGYAALSELSKTRLVDHLKHHDFIGDLRSALSPLIYLFPECPLNFITHGHDLETTKESAIEAVGDALSACLYRGEKLPTLAQGVYYDILRASKKLYIPRDLTDHKTELLIDYPDTKESQMTAGFMRCCATSIPMEKTLEGNDNSLQWPRSFWGQCSKIGTCSPIRKEGVYLSDLPQDYILYLAETFRDYSEESVRLWDTINENYDFDAYWSLRDDILLGLASRIYRLTIQIVSFTPNWNEDISQVYLRMIVESYIYYSWLKTHGKKVDFESFYTHGLGQQKLSNEHTKAYMQEHGLTEERAEDIVDSMSFLKGHKLPMFVPVNIGNPLSKNLGLLAEEADLKEFYALIFSPTSSAVHGSYDNLDQHYLQECANPFHCCHKVPYYWYKSPLSLYGVLNSLSITDWVLNELLGEVNAAAPEKMPGSSYIEKINDEERIESFAGREDIKAQCQFFEERMKDCFPADQPR